MESYYGPGGEGWNASPPRIAEEEATEVVGEGSDAVPPRFPDEWDVEEEAVMDAELGEVVKMEVKDELEEFVNLVSCFLA